MMNSENQKDGQQFDKDDKSRSIDNEVDVRTWLEGRDGEPACGRKAANGGTFDQLGTPEVINGSSFDDSGHLPPISLVADPSASAELFDSKGQASLISPGPDDSDACQDFDDQLFEDKMFQQQSISCVANSAELLENMDDVMMESSDALRNVQNPSQEQELHPLKLQQPMEPNITPDDINLCEYQQIPSTMQNRTNSGSITHGFRHGFMNPSKPNRPIERSNIIDYEKILEQNEMRHSLKESVINLKEQMPKQETIGLSPEQRKQQRRTLDKLQREINFRLIELRDQDEAGDDCQVDTGHVGNGRSTDDGLKQTGSQNQQNMTFKGQIDDFVLSPQEFTMKFKNEKTDSKSIAPTEEERNFDEVQDFNKNSINTRSISLAEQEQISKSSKHEGFEHFPHNQLWRHLQERGRKSFVREQDFASSSGCSNKQGQFIQQIINFEKQQDCHTNGRAITDLDQLHPISGQTGNQIQNLYQSHQNYDSNKAGQTRKIEAREEVQLTQTESKSLSRYLKKHQRKNSRTSRMIKGMHTVSLDELPNLIENIQIKQLLAERNYATAEVERETFGRKNFHQPHNDGESKQGRKSYYYSQPAQSRNENGIQLNQNFKQGQNQKVQAHNYNSATDAMAYGTPTGFRKLLSLSDFKNLGPRQYGQSMLLERGLTFGQDGQQSQPYFNTTQKTQLDLINQTTSNNQNFQPPPIGMQRSHTGLNLNELHLTDNSITNNAQGGRLASNDHNNSCLTHNLNSMMGHFDQMFQSRRPMNLQNRNMRSCEIQRSELSEFEQNRKQNKDLIKENALHKQSIDQLKEQISDLQEKEENAKQQQDAMFKVVQEENERLEEQNRRIMDEHRSLKQTYQEDQETFNTQMKEQETRMSLLKSQLQEKTQEANQLLDKVSLNQTRIQAIQESHEKDTQLQELKFQHELDNAKQQVFSMQQQNKIQQIDFEKQVSDLKLAFHFKNQFSIENTNFSKDQMIQQIDEGYRCEINQYELQIQELRDSIQEFINNEDGLRERLKSDGKQNSTLQKNLSEKGQELKKLREAQRSHARTIADLNEKIQLAQTSLTTKDKENKRLRFTLKKSDENSKLNLDKRQTNSISQKSLTMRDFNLETVLRDRNAAGSTNRLRQAASPENATWAIQLYQSQGNEQRPITNMKIVESKYRTMDPADNTIETENGEQQSLIDEAQMPSAQALETNQTQQTLTLDLEKHYMRSKDVDDNQIPIISLNSAVADNFELSESNKKRLRAISRGQSNGRNSVLTLQMDQKAAELLGVYQEKKQLLEELQTANRLIGLLRKENESLRHHRDKSNHQNQEMQKEIRFLLQKLMSLEQSCSSGSPLSKGQLPYKLKLVNSQSTNQVHSNDIQWDSMGNGSGENYILINHENLRLSDANGGQRPLGSSLAGDHFAASSGEIGGSDSQEVAEFTVRKGELKLEKRNELRTSRAQSKTNDLVPVLNLKMVDLQSYDQELDTKENQDPLTHHNKRERHMLENYQTAQGPRTGKNDELADHFVHRHRNSDGVASPSKNMDHNQKLHHEYAGDISSDIFSADPQPVSKNPIQPAGAQGSREVLVNKNSKQQKDPLSYQRALNETKLNKIRKNFMKRHQRQQSMYMLQHPSSSAFRRLLPPDLNITDIQEGTDLMKQLEMARQQEIIHQQKLHMQQHMRNHSQPQQAQETSKLSVSAIAAELESEEDSEEGALEAGGRQLVQQMDSVYRSQGENDANAQNVTRSGGVQYVSFDPSLKGYVSASQHPGRSLVDPRQVAAQYKGSSQFESTQVLNGKVAKTCQRINRGLVSTDSVGSKFQGMEGTPSSHYYNEGDFQVIVQETPSFEQGQNLNAHGVHLLPLSHLQDPRSRQITNQAPHQQTGTFSNPSLSSTQQFPKNLHQRQISLGQWSQRSQQQAPLQHSQCSSRQVAPKR